MRRTRRLNASMRSTRRRLWPIKYPFVVGHYGQQDGAAFGDVQPDLLVMGGTLRTPVPVPADELVGRERLVAALVSQRLEREAPDLRMGDEFAQMARRVRIEILQIEI